MKAIILSFLLCTPIFVFGSDAKAIPLTSATAGDIKQMWETVPMASDPTKKVSSAPAVAAAHRVFMAIPLTGMSREDVISLLGDPVTSSDSNFNVPFYRPPKKGMVYRFDTGTGGWQFDLILDKKNHVTNVITRGIGEFRD
ncbi:MAG: hypothetical protein ABI443_04190 [Chthoniobacterales bacterium]